MSLLFISLENVFLVSSTMCIDRQYSLRKLYHFKVLILVSTFILHQQAGLDCRHAHPRLQGLLKYFNEPIEIPVSLPLGVQGYNLCAGTLAPPRPPPLQLSSQCEGKAVACACVPVLAQVFRGLEGAMPIRPRLRQQ